MQVNGSYNLMAKKTNQLVIDLGTIQLSAEQKKQLSRALHKAVAKQIKQAAEAPVARGPVRGTRGLGEVPAEAGLKTAVLDISFTNTETGLSHVTATCAGEQQSVDRSGKITISNAKKGRRIKIQGNSLGNCTITIDIDASPTQLNFPPGQISGSFFIL